MVSRICAGLDEELEIFCGRPLDHVHFPYVYLDATYVKARVNHQKPSANRQSRLVMKRWFEGSRWGDTAVDAA